MSIATALRPFVDFALPPRCPGYGATVAAQHHFCAACWVTLEFATGRGCALCNVPMPGFGAAECADCMAAAPRHDGARAAVAYGDIARHVVLQLKYGRRTGLAATMAGMLVRHIDGAGILVPVPLHRWRLWGRGFNQATSMAQALGRASGLQVATDLLTRKRPTGSMRGLSRERRAAAVRGVFRAQRRLAGETIWLVDDVYTTGATINACAAALKRAGAGRVIVLVWARVLRED